MRSRLAYLLRRRYERRFTLLLRPLIGLQFRTLVVEMSRAWREPNPDVDFVRIRVHLAHGDRSGPRHERVLRPGNFGADAHPEAGRAQ